MENALRHASWVADDHVEEPRRTETRAPPELFARAASRRGREALVGAAAAVIIGALWATGAWMTVNVSRALESAQRAAVTLDRSDPEPAIDIGRERTSRAPPSRR